jgi:hypothetical protein
MVTITEQIDLFHESICKLHLYNDVLESDESRPQPRQKYYSVVEYLEN